MRAFPCAGDRIIPASSAPPVPGFPPESRVPPRFPPAAARAGTRRCEGAGLCLQFDLHMIPRGMGAYHGQVSLPQIVLFLPGRERFQGPSMDRDGPPHGALAKHPGKGEVSKRAQAFHPEAAFFRALREKHVLHAQELRHEGVGRRGEDLLGRARLHDPPRSHDQQVPGEIEGIARIVSDMKDGDFQCFVDAFQLPPNALPRGWIQGGQGLVQKEHLGLEHQGPGQGHALSLSTGKPGGFPFQQGGDIEKLGDAVYRFPDDLPLLPAHLQAEGDVSIHREVGKEGVILVHHAQGPSLRRKAGDFLAVQKEGSPTDPPQPHDALEQQRFPRSRGSEYGHVPPPGYVEGHLLQPEGAHGEGNSLDAQHVKPPCAPRPSSGAERRSRGTGE